VGYAAPGTWQHAARDWRAGRVVFPHTTPDGSLVNLYGRAVGTAAQVPKAKRHDHLPGAKGYFNATALQEGDGPLWVCEGAFDGLSLLAAGVPRVVAIFGVQGWRWDWARAIRELVFALDADARMVKKFETSFAVGFITTLDLYSANLWWALVSLQWIFTFAPALAPLLLPGCVGAPPDLLSMDDSRHGPRPHHGGDAERCRWHGSEERYPTSESVDRCDLANDDDTC
jgi:hypothetical protein